jgi:hypothetical protein
VFILEGIKLMINRPNLFFLSLGLLFTFSTYAKLRRFETTHQKAMGGTGVGSILLEESAFLNPSSSPFFQLNSIYLQYDRGNISDDLNSVLPKEKNSGFVLAQGGPPLSGTFSYSKQSYLNDIRKSYGLSIASMFSPKSTFGVSLKKQSDYIHAENLDHDYYQTTFGITHVLEGGSSVGIVLNDPFKSYAHETKIITGLHKNIASYIFGSVDIGCNYTASEFSDTLLLRGALHIRVWDDFFIKAGAFNDKEIKEKGESLGLIWVQPKLSLNFAIKNTDNYTNSRNIVKDKESSFSFSFRGI